MKARLLFALLVVFLAVTSTSKCAADILDHWTKRATNSLNRVIYEGGLFIAVGQNGTILTSTDGATWTKQDSGTTANLRGAAYASSALAYSRFVVVGERFAIRVSNDATNWTGGVLFRPGILGPGPPFDFSVDSTDVASDGSRFVVVTRQQQTTNSADILVSPLRPETNWFGVWITNSTTRSGFEDIIYANGSFVAVGNIFNGIWVSRTEITNWAFHPGIYSYGVAYGNDRFIVVGNEGLPRISTDGGMTWSWAWVSPTKSGCLFS